MHIFFSKIARRNFWDSKTMFSHNVRWKQARQTRKTQFFFEKNNLSEKNIFVITTRWDVCLKKNI